MHTLTLSTSKQQMNSRALLNCCNIMHKTHNRALSLTRTAITREALEKLYVHVLLIIAYIIVYLFK